MLKIHTDKVKSYLNLIGKSQRWMAEQYGCRPSFISSAIHNEVSLSGKFVGFMTYKMNMDFYDTFFWDEAGDYVTERKEPVLTDKESAKEYARYLLECKSPDPEEVRIYQAKPYKKYRRKH